MGKSLARRKRVDRSRKCLPKANNTNATTLLFFNACFDANLPYFYKVTMRKSIRGNFKRLATE